MLSLQMTQMFYLKSLMYKNEYIEIIKVFDRFKVNVLPSTTYMHFITPNTKIKKL